jgi:hypothetical protein
MEVLKEVNDLEKQEILNVIANLKERLEKLCNLSEERMLAEEEQREEENLIKALELMRLELPERPLTVQLEFNP